MKKGLCSLIAGIITANLLTLGVSAYKTEDLKGEMLDVKSMPMYSQKYGENFNDKNFTNFQAYNVHADSFASEYIEEASGDYSLKLTAKKVLTNHGDTYFDILSFGSGTKTTHEPYLSVDKSKFSGRPVILDIYMDVYPGQTTTGMTQRMVGQTNGDHRGDNIKLLSKDGVLGTSEYKYEAEKWYTFRTHIDSYERTRKIYVRERDNAASEELLIYQGAGKEAFSHIRWNFSQDSFKQGEYVKLDNIRMEGQFESGRIIEITADGNKVAAGAVLPAGTDNITLKFFSHASLINAKWINSGNEEIRANVSYADYGLTSWGAVQTNADFKGGLVTFAVPGSLAGDSKLVIEKGSKIDGIELAEDKALDFTFEVTEPVIASPKNGEEITKKDVTFKAILPARAEKASFFVDGVKYDAAITNSIASVSAELAENGTHTVQLLVINKDGTSESEKCEFDVNISNEPVVIRDVDFSASFKDRSHKGMTAIANGLTSGGSGAGAAIVSPTNSQSSQNEMFVCINGTYANTQIATEEGRGEYLKITATDKTGNLGNVYLNCENAYAYSGRIVYSMDLKVSADVGMAPMIRLYETESTSGKNVNIGPFGDYDWTKTAVLKDGKIFTSGVSYPINDWFNLKLVVDSAKDKYELYLNDEYVTEVNNQKGSLSGIAAAGRIYWRMRMLAGGEMSIDNYKVYTESAKVSAKDLAVTANSVSFVPSIDLTADDVKLYVNGAAASGAKIAVQNGQVRVLNKFNSDDDVKILFGKGKETVSAKQINGTNITELKSTVAADCAVMFSVADNDGLYTKTLADDNGTVYIEFENTKDTAKSFSAYFAGYEGNDLVGIDCEDVTLGAKESKIVPLTAGNGATIYKTFIWGANQNPLR